MESRDIDDPSKCDKITLRKYSDSTCSNGSDTQYSEFVISYSPQNRSTSFSVFSVYDDKFSEEVIKTTEKHLITSQKFNEESAACFIGLKAGLTDNFDYEGPLEKTKNVRLHALNFLNERDFFPKDYPKQSKKILVHALQCFLQKRYALLNYCMKILLDQPTGTNEFFLVFVDKSSITQKFPESLANYFLQNPATQKLTNLEEIFFRRSVWTTITAAFSSYSAKNSYYECFCRKLCCF
jgi:hypothetical protein